MSKLMKEIRKVVGSKPIKESEKGFQGHTPDFVTRSLTSFNQFSKAQRAKNV